MGLFSETLDALTGSDACPREPHDHYRLTIFEEMSGRSVDVPAAAQRGTNPAETIRREVFTNVAITEALGATATDYAISPLSHDEARHWRRDILVLKCLQVFKAASLLGNEI